MIHKARKTRKGIFLRRDDDKIPTQNTCIPENLENKSGQKISRNKIGKYLTSFCRRRSRLGEKYLLMSDVFLFSLRFRIE